jgi:hypothetical protein
MKIFDILEPSDSESENESNDDDSEFSSGIDSQFAPEMDSEMFTAENPGGTPKPPSETKPENDLPKKNKRKILKKIVHKLSKN